ncbi:hypothetical protein NHP190012_07030 [Helicobacter sp. NHP19-012]|uniref:Outer membrane protein n=1 Tax=Helicobacter gastrofelis TaxID=2849642 RepID=A0ABN6I652_9HELI|nr:outer membrane protein [Helicobacter sp. NHP19-012]BCZ19061.1 hypothetical protein NHP190012_07030 [Helicobacter sp. NHP19-012]
MLLRKAIVACGLCVCVSNLGAEKSGAYVEGGFQYSNFSGIRSVDNTPLPTPKRVTTNGFTNTYGEHGRNVMGALYNGNLYGVDLQFGYKQFFGKKRHFGLRYYGMFSGQGGEFSGRGLALGTSYVNQPSANLFYGVGMDALFNLYERGDRTFGFFAGVMIGGSSWLMGQPSGNASCRWEKIQLKAPVVGL